MLPNNDEHLDRLILRRLHGETDEADERELEDRLRHDPAARRLLLDYREVEARAEAALGAVGAALSRVSDVDEIARRACAGERAVRRLAAARGRWWIVPAALAASVVVGLVIPADPWGRRPALVERDGAGTRLIRAPSSEGDRLPSLGDVPSAPERPSAEWPVFRPVADVPHATHRSTDRDLVGVVGKDGRTIYFLQIDRTRTSRVPTELMKPASDPGGV